MKTKRAQSGGGALTTVMLISAVGLLLMSGLQHQLDGAARMGNDERHYLRAFNQAQSSLNWGLSLHWQESSDGWQCQILAAENLTACLRRSSDAGQGVLRGEGRLPASPRPLALYQRVAALTSLSRHVTLQPMAHGWLDFCPDPDDAQCRP